MLGLLVLAACSHGDYRPESETAAESEQIFCRGYCKSAERCGTGDGTCELACQDSYSATWARPSALADVGRCMERLQSCESWSGEDPSEPCFDEVRASLQPNEFLIDYCESASQRFFECSAWWSVDECLTTMGLWADAVLGQALACHENEVCQEMFDCEVAVWERY